MQHGRHDIREVRRFLRHRRAAERPALHHQHGREFRPMQPAMHAAALRHIRRIEGRVAMQAPFVGFLRPREGCDQIGAARVAAAEQRQRQRPSFRQDRRIAREQWSGPILAGQEIRDLRRKRPIAQPQPRRRSGRDDHIHIGRHARAGAEAGADQFAAQAPLAATRHMAVVGQHDDADLRRIGLRRAPGTEAPEHRIGGAQRVQRVLRTQPAPMEGDVGLRQPQQRDIRSVLRQHVVEQHATGELHARNVGRVVRRGGAERLAHLRGRGAFGVLDIPAEGIEPLGGWVQQARRTRRACADQREALPGWRQALGEAQPLQRRFSARRERHHVTDQLGAQQPVRRDRRIEQRIRHHPMPARPAAGDERGRGDARLGRKHAARIGEARALGGERVQMRRRRRVDHVGTHAVQRDHDDAGHGKRPAMTMYSMVQLPWRCAAGFACRRRWADDRAMTER